MTILPTILIVDDDASVREAVMQYLTAEGYKVFGAQDGASMRRILLHEEIAIVLLDVMLPGESGFSLARELSRRPDLGIIMLSACGTEADRVSGLEVGADDYITKPASPRELLARVRAVYRRYRGKGGPVAGFQFNGWGLDPLRRVLRDSCGALVSLSEGEFELLLAFVENPRTVLGRDQLLDLARGDSSDAFGRAIDTQVSRLRRKLVNGGKADLIRTVRGQGYFFDAEITRL